METQVVPDWVQPALHTQTESSAEGVELGLQRSQRSLLGMKIELTSLHKQVVLSWLAEVPAGHGLQGCPLYLAWLSMHTHVDPVQASLIPHLATQVPPTLLNPNLQSQALVDGL